MSRLPECYELSIGEELKGNFGADHFFTVTLAKVETFFEPFYQDGDWYEIFWKARVDVTVNGVEASLWCKPYQIPVKVAGLNMQVDLVKGVEGGLDECALKKDIRISLRDAGLPWITKNYCFPVRNYKWRGSNYAHTWNGFVSVHSRTKTVYYHRGEDFGAIPERHMIAALDDSVLHMAPQETGDGDSNYILTRDADYQYCYAHANAPFAPEVFHAGRALKQGEGIKLTGNTWNGRPVRDPHLHISMETCPQADKLNTFFPMLTAYKESYPDELLAVAEGFRFCRAGESLTLDASATEEINECAKLNYTWELCDKSLACGSRITVRYERPGTYTEKVIVRDEKGRRAVDHVIVSVFDRQGSERPFCWLNVYPMRHIKVWDDVEFLAAFYNMENVVIDFGDGGRKTVADNQSIRHVYGMPGCYTVTVAGEGPGGAGIFKLEVLVEEADEG